MKMNRRKFLQTSGVAIAAAGGLGYTLSDRHSFTRSHQKGDDQLTFKLQEGEREILILASLAPSGHNSQPWAVTYQEPFHWTIGNDSSRWLPSVDPTQRETILSIGAFIQNLEYSAESLGYRCRFTLVARNNQDRNLMDVRLEKMGNRSSFDTDKISMRRTIRSNFLKDKIRKEDIDFLVGEEREYVQFIPQGSTEFGMISKLTLEANRQQTYRDDAQAELADWIRLTSMEAEKHADGLTTASMEIDGIPGWVVRNFYDRNDILSREFRQQGLDRIGQQVSCSGGWLLITSNDHATGSLVETGMRLQRVWLRARERRVAIHPMTQILEEPYFREELMRSLVGGREIQFILRVGYIKKYPEPVSLRRPIGTFIQQLN